MVDPQDNVTQVQKGSKIIFKISSAVYKTLVQYQCVAEISCICWGILVHFPNIIINISFNYMERVKNPLNYVKGPKMSSVCSLAQKCTYNKYLLKNAPSVSSLVHKCPNSYKMGKKIPFFGINIYIFFIFKHILFRNKHYYGTLFQFSFF